MITVQEFEQLAESQKFIDWARKSIKAEDGQDVDVLLKVVYTHLSDITNDYLVAQRLKDDENTG